MNDWGEIYYQDPSTKLWGHAAYHWVDRVIVLKESAVVDDLSREQFKEKYPDMVEIPADPRITN